MKTRYESFKEIADDFTDGTKIAHASSEHSDSCCYIWQTAIDEFAKALDLAGAEVPQTDSFNEDFWANIEKAFRPWKEGYSRYDTCLDPDQTKEITLEEAKKMFPKEKNLKVGDSIDRLEYGTRKIELNGIFTRNYIIKK